MVQIQLELLFCTEITLRYPGIHWGVLETLVGSYTTAKPLVSPLQSRNQRSLLRRFLVFIKLQAGRGLSNIGHPRENIDLQWGPGLVNSPDLKLYNFENFWRISVIEPIIIILSVFNSSEMVWYRLYLVKLIITVRKQLSDIIQCASGYFVGEIARWELSGGRMTK